MTVTELIREIFDEPDFKSIGTCSDFTLERILDTLSVRIVERESDYIVLEVLNRVNRIGKIKRTHKLKMIEELELHLRNIRKEYLSFVFHSRF
jgi:hypothetical protein